MVEWRFYGRHLELQQLGRILARQRWFFVKITGRRRIGKTTLVRNALPLALTPRAFYVQIPDSEGAGVLSAVRDALDTFWFLQTLVKQALVGHHQSQGICPAVRRHVPA